MNVQLLPDSPLSSLPRISARELQALQAAGINQVQHLLRRLPRRYEDRRSSSPLHLLQNGEKEKDSKLLPRLR